MKCTDKIKLSKTTRIKFIIYIGEFKDSNDRIAIMIPNKIFAN